MWKAHLQVYLEQYRDDAGIRMLKKLGVKIRKLEK
jgi:hypothetical protein